MIFVFESPPHTNISSVDSALIVPSHWRYDLDRYKELGDFFFFGSIETALRLKEIGVGNIHLDKSFEFSNYAREINAKSYLLNDHYFVCSSKDVNNIINHTKAFNEYGLVFAKPDSYLKLFDGGLYHFSDEMFDGLDDFRVILSNPKTIAKEYRCFLVRGKVKSVSVYREFGRLREYNDDEHERNIDVVNFAEEYFEQSAKLAELPSNIVIDIAEMMINVTSKVLKVIEVNSINTSGFYLCDIRKITKAIQKEFKKC